MKKQTEIEKTKAAVNSVNKELKFINPKGKRYSDAKAKKMTFQEKLIALKTESRQQPLMRVDGLPFFHVLTKSDLENIWKLTGTKRVLVRANGMLTAKYSFKRKDKIVIYLDVRPAGIFYCTRLM